MDSYWALDQFQGIIFNLRHWHWCAGIGEDKLIGEQFHIEDC